MMGFLSYYWLPLLLTPSKLSFPLHCIYSLYTLLPPSSLPKKKISVFCLYWCIIHPPNQFPPVFLHKRYGYTILYPPLSIILFNTFLSLSILCMYYNPDIHLISILLHPSFNIYDIQHLLHSPFFYFPFFLLFLPL